MKAKIHPRARIQGRPFLPDFIPLRTPFIIDIDPSDKCNLRCSFCPTGDHDLMRATPGRNFGPMKWDTFKRAIDGCSGFESKVKVARLYKDGEPLSNPQFAKMVAYIKQSGYFEIADTTTNALLLTREKSDEIIEAGLDRINISIYGMDSEQYSKFCHREVNFSRLVESLRYFYEKSRGKCVMNIKINADILPNGNDSTKFFETFGDMCDEIATEHVMECWSGFDFAAHGITANEKVGIYGHTIHEKKVCPYVFYSFALNTNGDVSVCFLDWAHKMLVGNITENTLPELWNGQKMTEHRLMMLRGGRKDHPVCGNCGQMSHGTIDDIDVYAEDLMRRF